jgi:hypothetical protein
MSQTKGPEIEFPCHYPIKVIGDHAEDFAHEVTRVIQRFDPQFDPASMTAQPSRNSRFISVRVSFYATSESQIRELFEALKATGRVHMVV